jgi:thioredoxin reductase
MNFRVDVIIVGDSTSGHAILDKIASSRSSIKLAFISQTFKSTTTHDYANVKYFKNEVEYVSYRHRLFCCYMKNGDNIFGTHLVIASGLNYEPLVINNESVPCVFNTVDDVPRIAKDQPALVICSQESDTKFAMEVAKKYKQVYLCTKGITIEGLTEANTKKLDKAENLVVLHNTSLNKTISKEGALLKVELNNYTTLNCNAIYVKTNATPSTEFVSDKLIQKTEDGYLTTAANAESTLVPKCFAAGNCVKKYTQKMEQLLVETILKDF